MNSDLLFLLGCMPVRAMLVWFAKYKPQYLRAMGYAALVPAIGFLSLYHFDLRSRGVETNGRPIWWRELRPIHGLLYLGFALYAIKRRPYAHLFLILDAALGFLFFIFYKRRANVTKKSLETST